MTASSVSPTFYADFQGLERLHASAEQKDPKALKEAAKQFEGLLTSMMLKSMREASLGSGLGDSQETQTYQDMYDQQLSLQIAHGKGLGLADMLVQQLTRNSASAASGSSSGGYATPGAGGGISVPASSSSTATGSTPVASASQRADFVRSMEPMAQAASQSLGVSPDTLIAQAALETGWGRNLPSTATGQSSNNLFGIKASGGWSGDSAAATTVEFSQGAAQRVNQSFRSYGTTEQSMNDYVSLLQGNSRYASALGTGTDVQAFGTALSRGGYATDPDYVNKLVATADSLRQLRATVLKS